VSEVDDPPKGALNATAPWRAIAPEHAPGDVAKVERVEGALQQDKAPLMVFPRGLYPVNGYVLSTVSAEENRHYSTTADYINSQRFMAFLKQLIQGRSRPLILLLDRASFHGSKPVRGKNDKRLHGRHNHVNRAYQF
jgi:hypothetical protein